MQTLMSTCRLCGCCCDASIVRKYSLHETVIAEKLIDLWSQLPNVKFLRPSFPPIVAVGPHAAVIHYVPTPETSASVVEDDVLLLDVGAHYTYVGAVFQMEDCPS